MPAAPLGTIAAGKIHFSNSGKASASLYFHGQHEKPREQGYSVLDKLKMGKPQRHGGTEAAQSFSPCDLPVSVSPWLIRLLDLEN